MNKILTVALISSILSGCVAWPIPWRKESYVTEQIQCWGDPPYVQETQKPYLIGEYCLHVGVRGTSTGDHMEEGPYTARVTFFGFETIDEPIILNSIRVYINGKRIKTPQAIMLFGKSIELPNTFLIQSKTRSRFSFLIPRIELNHEAGDKLGVEIEASLANDAGTSIKSIRYDFVPKLETGAWSQVEV